MTLTTAQRLAQAEKAHAETIAQEEALREEIARLQAQQKVNRAEIDLLQQKQTAINAAVASLEKLDDDLFAEVMAIASRHRNEAEAPQHREEKEERPTSQPAPKEKMEIPSYLINAIKSALIPYCLGISEILENAILLEDYDNQSIAPGTIFWENNNLNPSQNLLNWISSQHHEWEEMKAEVEAEIKKVIKASEPSEPEAEPNTEQEVFEHPYKPLGDQIFILISEEEPLTGWFKQRADMPRHYEILRHNSEIILEITTTNGSKLRSHWGKFPGKYRTASRLILKHYAESPELLERFNTAYPDEAKQDQDIFDEAKQAKQDIFPEQYPLGYSEENPVGKGKTPGFQMKRV